MVAVSEPSWSDWPLLDSLFKPIHVLSRQHTLLAWLLLVTLVASALEVPASLRELADAGAQVLDPAQHRAVQLDEAEIAVVVLAKRVKQPLGVALANCGSTSRASAAFAAWLRFFVWILLRVGPRLVHEDGAAYEKGEGDAKEGGKDGVDHLCSGEWRLERGAED